MISLRHRQRQLTFPLPKIVETPNSVNFILLPTPALKMWVCDEIRSDVFDEMKGVGHRYRLWKVPDPSLLTPEDRVNLEKLLLEEV